MIWTSSINICSLASIQAVGLMAAVLSSSGMARMTKRLLPLFSPIFQPEHDGESAREH